MKHLKHFNEKLNISTYIRSVNKFKELGHNKRATNMQNWVDIKRKEAKEKARLEEIRYWEDSISKYSKFGTYKFQISDASRNKTFDKIVDDFYGAVVFDRAMFSDIIADEIEYAKSNREKECSAWLSLFMVAIPKTKEEYDKYQSMPAIKSSMWRGGIFGLWLSFRITIIGDLISVTKFEIYADDGQEIRLNITDRSTAGKIKNLLAGIFKGTIDYDVKYPSTGLPNNLHDFIETVVCNQSGLTSDYGLNMDHFVDALKNTSANSLFKES